MKKIILIFMMLMSINIGINAQDKFINSPSTYFDVGYGAMIPSDGSNSFGTLTFEFGGFVTPIFGLGCEFKYGSEGEYSDRIGLLGINTHINTSPYYVPNRIVELDFTAGIGYGWVSFANWYNDNYDGYVYKDGYSNTSFVVPKVGANLAFNLNKQHSIQAVLSPEYAWYISFDKENSVNVGAFDIFGKLRFYF